MTKPDGIIFDIDGTLWSASAASAAGWTKGFSRLGIDRRVLPEEIEGVAGKPFSECVQIIHPTLSAVPDTLGAALNEEEALAVQQWGGRLFPGVAQGIPRLAGAFPVFVISNCQSWYYRLFMEKTGLEKWVLDGDCHGNKGENKSEMIRGMVEKHGLRHPVYIGDTAGDEKAAGEAGVLFFYAAYGFGNVSEPDRTFSSFSEVVDVLLGVASSG